MKSLRDKIIEIIWTATENYEMGAEPSCGSVADAIIELLKREGQMKPIGFPEARTIMGADQPEYLPLPCHRMQDGQVISLWQLSWRERVKIFFTGKLWLRQLTFNQPLQPQRPDIDRPFEA